jgi:hypothetical protein
VLGVDRSATSAEIRAAYRDLARRLHPDRAASGGGDDGGRAMASINEAYRVLSDPGRRVVYDRSLDGAPTGHGSAAGSAAARPADTDDWDGRERPAAPRHTVLSPAGPARVPWKLMGVLAIVGSGAVLVSSFFDDPPSVEAPDGLLQLGSCVAFEPNGDVREVACAGTAEDVVVEIMVPLDGACPAGTDAHRDRQGIVMVCIPNE